ncbi:hypothetical protein BP6252_01709 [Coleophoma cylindrospora]|uniref:Zn(2)-C6 fungal-type domain-containing protein n=1 Tax=Coleophoma cylindrospora TaxID=1849047 RepID=A0A3D8STP6_9HELO|nr:hypothetical protein BP6252_01709 [Coleophoma cylindrospora]
MDAASNPNELRRRKRKSRGKGLRKTTGCITCRRRHLKCDEGTPTCGQCTKSRQTCIYAVPGVDLPQPSGEEVASTVATPVPTAAVPRGVRSPSPMRERPPTQQAITVQGSPPQVAASPRAGGRFASWDANFPDHDRTQAASGLLHLNSSGPFPQSYPRTEVISPPGAITYAQSQTSITDTNEASVHSAATPPDAAFYRWFGLLANDAVQEDGAVSRFSRPFTAVTEDSVDVHSLSLISPRQTASRTLSSGQNGEEFRRYSRGSTSAPTSSELVSIAPQKKNAWQGSEPAKLLDHEHAIFENFVKNVSRWIDLFDPTGCFSNFVPHLAMHDAGLMSAILALSSRHLSLHPNSREEQRDRNIGLQYYYETLHYLQKAMHYDSYTVSLELLATALTVSTYEMLDDSGSGWERHLKGVFWIQRSQVIHGESEGLKSAVWWAWLRQDVWAAFRERRKTLSFWKPKKAYNTMTPYELAARSVWLFAKAVDYCSTEEIEAGEESLQPRMERAEAIFEMLGEWQRYLTTEFTPLPLRRSSPADVFEPIWIHPPAFAVSVQLHCSARILLLLHRPSFGGMRGYMEQQKLLAKAVDTICGIAMTLTDDAASVMSSQCLYIAGLCVQETRQREAVLALIDTCHRRTGWPTVSLSEDLKADWQKSHFV